MLGFMVVLLKYFIDRAVVSKS